MIPYRGHFMKHKVFLISIVILSLSVLPGCHRYECWLKDVFYQGECIDKHACIVRQYIRSEHVYDQFSTVAHFDALWLSDEVRTAYAQVYATKHCLSDERYTAFLRRQQEENRHYISLYLLSAFRAHYGSPLLNEKDAEWSICLQVGDCAYRPIEVKLVEMSPEYVMFYGKIYTRFKTAYMIKFDANDIAGNPIFARGIPSFALLFTSADRRIKLVWCLDGNGNVILRDMNHPDVLAYDIWCH